MDKVALLLGVTLITILGVTTGTEEAKSGPSRPSIHFFDDPPSDTIQITPNDPYVASGSRNSHQIGGHSYRSSRGRTSSRSLTFDDGEETYSLSESNTRPHRRRIPGTRRRRPLDPERRQLLLRRREKLGLPIPKFLRDKQKKNEATQTENEQNSKLPVDEKQEDVSILIGTPGPSLARVFPDVFTTTQPTTPPPTPKSRFPSFSAASKLRERFKAIKNEWGLKTAVKEENEQKSDNEPSTEPSRSRNRSTPRTRVVTTTTRGLNREDKRLRYRPVLVRKKLRSKVKVTSPAPYPVEDPPVIEPVPVDYFDEEERYEESYEPVLPDPPSRNSFDPEPYYFNTDSPINEAVTKPRHTPVPKKVALEPVTQRPKKRFQTTRPTPDTSQFKSKTTFRGRNRVRARDPTPIPITSSFTPTTTPTYSPESEYDPAPTYAPEPDYDSELAYTPEIAYFPEPAYHREPAYAPEPNYSSDEIYTQEQEYSSEPIYSPEPHFAVEPQYAPEPAYAYDPVYVDDPTYSLAYEDDPLYALDAGNEASEEYPSDDYEDKPSIFDQYKYGYSVASQDTGNFHERSEARDGETVSGSYKVALPDGRVQTVTYVADDNGFRAEVNYEGEAIEHTPSSNSHSAPSPSPPLPSSSPFRESFSKTRPRHHSKESNHRFSQDNEEHQSFAQDHGGGVQDFESFSHHRSPNRPRSDTRSSRPLAPPSHEAIRPRPGPHRLRPRPVHQPLHQSFEKSISINPDLEDTPTPTQAPRPLSQNLHFQDLVHVTTPSPNPFRLVVEKSRLSTFAPVFTDDSNSRSSRKLHETHFTTIPTTPAPHVGTFTPTFEAVAPHTTPHTTTFSPAVTTFEPIEDNGFPTTTPSSKIFRSGFVPSNFFRSASSTAAHTTPRSETTNGHTMRPPHSTTIGPDINSDTVYQYQSRGEDPRPGSQTSLYNPDPSSGAYIHALGRTHAVPILLPVNHGEEHPQIHQRAQIIPTSTPRTYYLNTPAYVFPGQHSTPSPQIVQMIRVTPAPLVRQNPADGVEIVRGDSVRPRLTLKIPEPHEADIYPTPRPRIMIL